MTPFQKAYIPAEEVARTVEVAHRELITDPVGYRAKWGFAAETPWEEIKTHIESVATEGDVYLNDKYQVNTRLVASQPGWPPLLHLSIKRIDRAPVHDWRELQQIKNEIVGPDCEAVELYPAESRVVDTANQYHLWCLAAPGTRFPFGFTTGVRSEGSMGKSVQRPFSQKIK